MLDKHVPLFEGAVVEQQFDALARRQLAFLVLRVDTLLSTAESRLLALVFESLKNVLHGCLSFSVIAAPRGRLRFLG
ncbi:hypothetical protein D3C78_1347040 [compost metagenome]